MFWGISESLDLYQEYLDALKHKKDTGTAKNKRKDEEVANQSNSPEKGNDEENGNENVPKESEYNDVKNGDKANNEESEKVLEVIAVKNEDEEKKNDEVETAEEKYDIYKSNEKENETDNIENEVEKNEFENKENENKENVNETINQPTSLNILLLGAGDPRHLIKTIAKLYKHRQSNRDNTIPILNVYILEGCVEIVARNIALLGIALENPEKFSLRNKVHLFMDIYGNALVRPASHHYLVGKVKTLLKMVTDDEKLENIAPFLNIERLKYRERDGLENAFNFWLPKEGHIFNMPEYWIARLRKHLGVRYDFRDGAFDWDLNMTLKYREAMQICSQEYRYWRETGIAFTFPEYEQCKPNKTLSAGLVRNGEKYIHRGYVGDIEVGPFCTFGLRTRDERLTKSAHGENDYRSTDVTERNLLELFHEIEKREAYEHNTEISRRYGAVRLQMGNRFTWNECDIDVMQEYDQPWLPIEGVKINFLSADEVFTLQDANGCWRDFFDVAFVGHNYFTFIKSTFTEVLRANALLIMETKLLTLARKEAVLEFEEKLKSFAKTANLTNCLNYNAINANFTVMKFRKQIKSDE